MKKKSKPQRRTWGGQRQGVAATPGRPGSAILVYWVVCNGYHYEIVLAPADVDMEKNNGSATAFATLSEAKRQARDWLRSDRRYLEDQLNKIRNTKAADLKRRAAK